MAEALAVPSAVAGLLSLTIQLGGLSAQFISDARDAPVEIRAYLHELSDLEKILQSLHDTYRNSPAPSGIPLVGIEDCSRRLLGIKNSLEKTDRSRNPVKRLGWPFRETDTRKHVEAIQRYRGMLSDVFLQQAADRISKGTKRNAQLAEDNLDEVREVKRRVFDSAAVLQQTADDASYIKAEVDTVLDTTEALLNSTDHVVEQTSKSNKLAILNWLSSVDSSVIHNIARNRHQPGTGEWILQRTEFIDWQRSPTGIFWLHGGPGTGKTILASGLIELFSQTPSLSGSLAFYYFDFNDSRTLTLSSFLRAVLRQVVSLIPGIPKELNAIYEHNVARGQQPSTRSLISLLYSLLQSLRELVVVIDALDECPERVAIVELLSEWTDRYRSGLKILLTSRHLPDIEEGLGQIACRVVSFGIHKSHTESDIKLYIENCLAKDPQMRKLSSADLPQIDTELTQGANGMFRWVDCQLDALKKCRTSNALAATLKSLPQTLEGTYARILHQLDPRDGKLLVAAFKWLVFARRTLTLHEVAEATVVKSGSPFDRSDRLYEPHDVLNLSSGLLSQSLSIRFGYGHQTDIKLAHFSVQEFLKAKFLLGSDWESEERAHADIAIMCLNYLKTCTGNEEPITRKSLTEYPLLEYAGRYWADHAKHSCNNRQELPKELIEAIANFLDTSNPGYLNWLRVYLPDEIFGNAFNEYRTLRTSGVRSPLYYAYRFGLIQVAECLIQRGSSTDDFLQDTQKLLRTQSAEDFARILQSEGGHALLINSPLCHSLTLLPILKKAILQAIDDSSLRRLLRCLDFVTEIFFHREPGQNAWDILKRLSTTNLFPWRSADIAIQDFLSWAKGIPVPRGASNSMLQQLAQLPPSSEEQHARGQICLFAVLTGQIDIAREAASSPHNANVGPAQNGDDISVLQIAIVRETFEIAQLLIEAAACLPQQELARTDYRTSAIALTSTVDAPSSLLSAIAQTGVDWRFEYPLPARKWMKGTVLHCAVLEDPLPHREMLRSISKHAGSFVNSQSAVLPELNVNAVHFALVARRFDSFLTCYSSKGLDKTSSIYHEQGKGILHGTSILDLAVLQRLPIHSLTEVARDCARFETQGYFPSVHVASVRGDLEILELLLSSGANVDQQTKFGTALYQASHDSNDRVVRLLHEHNVHQVPTVAAFVSEKDEHYLNNLLEWETDGESSPLMPSPQSGDEARSNTVFDQLEPDETNTQRTEGISPAGSKKHKCPFCDTEFWRHHDLKSHLLTHSQENPYACSVCPNRFRRLHDLKRHMKLHTGEKSYICTICGHSFARADALARHNNGAGGCAGIRAVDHSRNEEVEKREGSASQLDEVDTFDLQASNEEFKRSRRNIQAADNAFVTHPKETQPGKSRRRASTGTGTEFHTLSSHHEPGGEVNTTTIAAATAMKRSASCGDVRGDEHPPLQPISNPIPAPPSLSSSTSASSSSSSHPIYKADSTRSNLKRSYGEAFL